MLNVITPLKVSVVCTGTFLTKRIAKRWDRLPVTTKRRRFLLFCRRHRRKILIVIIGTTLVLDYAGFLDYLSMNGKLISIRNIDSSKLDLEDIPDILSSPTLGFGNKQRLINEITENVLEEQTFSSRLRIFMLLYQPLYAIVVYAGVFRYGV